MKLRYSAFTLLVAASVALPAFAYGTNAEVKQETKVTASTTLPRVELKKMIEAKRASTTEALKERRASTTEFIREKKEELRGEVIKKHVNVVSQIIQATINRLQKIVTRIESRIAKIKSAGGNTASAEISVSAAKTNLADAQAHLTVMNSLDLSGSTSTIKMNFDKIKTEAKGARESLSSARHNLQKAVQLLRNVERTVKVKEDVEATTTATSTATTTATN